MATLNERQTTRAAGFDEEVDLVIVGGGGSALAAAAEAAGRGARVVLLEKAPRLGGTTRMAVGSIMAAGTRLQRAAGIDDTPDRHYAELEAIVEEAGIGDNRALRRLLVDHAGETVDFLEEIGVRFLGPLPQPPFATDRFYQALPGARAYVDRLLACARRRGAVLRTGCRVDALVRQDGRVTGVRYVQDGVPRAIAARAAVVLASGDMSADREARRALWGTELDELQPLNPASTGDGQRLGQTVGGRLALRPDLVPHGVPRFMPPGRRWPDRLPTWPPFAAGLSAALRHLPAAIVRPLLMRAAMTALAPEMAMYRDGAIMVNRDGVRFTDELRPVGGAIARQPEGEAYVLFDQVVAARYARWPHFVSTAPGIAYAYVDDYVRARPDIVVKAASLAELAQRLGCSAEAVEASFASRGGAAPVPPFYALGPLRTWLLITPAGLAVDARLRVLDDADRPIAGLRAAGGVGQGGLSFTHFHHGHSLGWAFTSGRLAARFAMEDAAVPVAA